MTPYGSLWRLTSRCSLYDRVRAAQVVDDLIATDMYLPIDSGESLFSWAYEDGLLPKE